MKLKVFLLFAIGFFAFCGAALASDASTKEFQVFLKELKKRFAGYGWDLKPEGVEWEYHRTTPGKRPLFFATFGSSLENCTLLLGTVHGDEIPTAYVLFKLAEHLKENPDLYKGRCIVVAPLVNPDGFLASPPRRVNSRGIDPNRNFPTRGWKKDALKGWETTGSRNKRYYPGQKPGSESETGFQIALINRFKPQKILSLHSPLNFYDYDGPSVGLDVFEKWLEKISRETNHPMKKLGVYPGSLGNYAGFERDIFVVTLELPSSEPRMGEQYYSQFKTAVGKFVQLGINGGKPMAESPVHK